MKMMKKAVAIVLTAVMLFSLAIPSTAMIWKSETANTSGFIVGEDKETVLNAGRLPSGVDISFGKNDPDWKYAYPTTFKKGVTPGGYPSDLDAQLYIAFNGQAIYIKEVRHNRLLEGDRSDYRIIMDNVALTEAFTPVGALASITYSVDDLGNPSVKSSSCSRLSYAWASNNSNNTLKADAYVKSTAGSITPVVSIVDGAYVIETAILWTDIGVLGGNGPVNDVRFGFKYRAKVGSADSYAQITSLSNVGGTHAAGAQTYHNDWDNFMPLYTRAANAQASSYAIDYSWYDAYKTEFELTTVGQLRGLAALINQQGSKDAAKAITKGKTFKLGARMDLNPGWSKSSTVAPLFYWIPMGVFSGTFDGQGYEITDMICHEKWTIDVMSGKSYDSWQRDVGFIAQICDSATIKNLKLTNAKVTSTWEAGGLIGKIWSGANTTIENVFVDAEILATPGKNTNQDSGILVGRIDGSGTPVTVKNVVVTGSGKIVTTGGNYIGPLWGRGSNAKSVITDVLVYDMALTTEGGNVSWGSWHGGNDKENKSNYLRLENGELYDLAKSSDSWNKAKADGWVDTWMTVDESGLKVPAGVISVMSRNVWVQKGIEKNGKFTVRVLNITDKQWDGFGVKVEMSYNGAEYVDVTSVVDIDEKYYKSVVSGGKKVTADVYGGEYIGCAKYAGVSAVGTVKLRITPINYVGSTPYAGAAAVVTYVDGVLQ